MFNFIKNLIAPKKCYSCGELGHFLCPECLKKLDNHKAYCYLCKKPSFEYQIHKECKTNDFYLDKIIVLTHYKNKIIEILIKHSKYYGKKDILEDFADYLSELFLKNCDEKISDYIIVSRPMYRFKKLFRGYNQADILATFISKNTGIVHYNNLVIKTKYTKSQSRLSRQDRLKNEINSFSINKKYISIIKGKKVIIVDDVVSSASTLNEIAKLLKNYKTSENIALVIASD
ncbi:MAG: phosphoribosyltransferase family protein [Candidatus Gracilibacteria bacterium]|nr:phosphoribosyltransferase family protein [Candidatus Gracilibacteria bacterium]